MGSHCLLQVYSIDQNAHILLFTVSIVFFSLSTPLPLEAGESTESLVVTSVVHRGEGDGTSLQYSCLENPMDGGA